MSAVIQRVSRSAADNLWVPAGLGRVPAALAIAGLSTLALLAVFVSGASFTMSVQRADSGASAGCAGPLAPAASHIASVADVACAGGDARQADGGQALTGPSVASVLRVPDCDGDGASGNRIAFYYAYFAGQKNRIGSARPNLIRAIEQANDIVYRAASSAGHAHSMRVLTDGDCTPIVTALRLPASARISLDATVRAAGLASASRVSVVFADTAHFCGVSTAAAASGSVAPRADLARVDLGCWTGAQTAREITALLGSGDSPYLYRADTVRTATSGSAVLAAGP